MLFWIIFERNGFQCYRSTEGAHIALRQKVVEPIGEARPVFEIEYELAKRMGLDGAYSWTNTEEWINHRLKAGGITLDGLRKQPVICVTPRMEYKKYLRDGFNTPSGKEGAGGARIIRRTVLRYGLPYATTLAGACAMASGIEAMKKRKLTVQSLQEFYEETGSAGPEGLGELYQGKTAMAAFSSKKVG